MKANTRRILVWAVAVGALVIAARGMAASKSSEPIVSANSLSAEQLAAAAAREKDPAWKPSHEEIGTIQVGDSKKGGALKNFCLNRDGNILACYAASGDRATSKNPSGIWIYTPKGVLLNTLPLEIVPSAICLAKDGSIFVAGEARILKVSPEGKVLASAPSPVAEQPVVLGKEVEELVQEMAKNNKRPFKDEMEQMKRTLETRRSEVTGLAVTDDDVFMAVPSPTDFGYRVYRFSHELGKAELVVEKLRGCCGQMDIQARDGKLWIPHNARHSIESRDRDGKELTKFGQKGRVKATDFGGCCEPKNIRILANGEILTAESGPPTCIKRFSTSGQFLGVVAVLETKGDCVRVTVEQSPDGSSYYLLDTTRDVIRVFKSKT